MNSTPSPRSFGLAVLVLGVLAARWERRTKLNVKSRIAGKRTTRTAIRTLGAAVVGCLASAAFGQTPANDPFANPQVITGVFGNATGTNVNATLETGEPTTTAGRSGGKSVWFRWTAPASGSFTFSLTATFDSQLAVYTGTAVGSLSMIAESDPPGSGGDAVTFSTTQNTNYQLRIDGYQSTGVFTLNWSANPVYEKLFSFTDAAAGSVSMGRYPRTDLVQGFDGNFYGTTSEGGASFCGTVFKLTPGGVLTTLVGFTGTAGSNIGRQPNKLVQGSDGDFYGTTKGGGAGDWGTVFKLTPGGELTTLVEFTGTAGSNKGQQPNELVEGSDGNFYGTTTGGGASYFGTVFKLTPSGMLTTLVEFTGTAGSNLGNYPYAGLIQGNDGNFYGTTKGGGASDMGTVFKLTPSGVLTTLVEFTGTASGYIGKYPYVGLVQGSDGNFYGTTHEGGASGAGTVFKLTPGGVLTTLVEFTGTVGSNKGLYPYASLMQGSDGNFYGTTLMGGASGAGTVFKLTSGGVLTTLVEFTGTVLGSKTGCFPYAGLVQDGDGNFYGTTKQGGAGDWGTVFKLTPGGVLTMLVEFTGTASGNIGKNPYAGLVQDSDGNFYGTTRQGGVSECGTIFKLTSGGVLTTLIEFTGAAASNKGRYPYASLVRGSDGNFYGTTRQGGASDRGTVFKLTPGGVLTTLVEFTGTVSSHKGKYPYAGLVQGGDGNFYGTTSLGGASDMGTVFKLTPDGELTTLVEFTGTASGYLGKYPHGSLVQDLDGNFYGTTEYGGASDKGTVFMLTPAGNMTTPVEFTGTAGSKKGMYPYAGLMQGGDGNFYGTTRRGGAYDYGTVFKLTPGGVLTTLIEFTGTTGNNMGRYPYAGLTQGNDGNFYGTTLPGGETGMGGMVFKITSGGALTTLHDFAGDPVDSQPYAAFVVGFDGNLYGTTLGGSANGYGCIYRMVFPGMPNVLLLPPEGLTTTSAAVQCKVNPRGAATMVTLEYGDDGIAFPNSVVIQPSFTGYQWFLVGRTLGNLISGSTYYYRFRAANSSGETLSTVQSVSTLAEPVVAIAAASGILPTSARLNGTLNARNFAATVVFEWGTDGNSFPNTVAATPGVVTGNMAVPVSADVWGLVKGTTYYYRVVATNVAGTGVSGTQGFTTLTEPVAVLGGASALSTTRARVAGTVDAKGSAVTVSFEWGTDGVDFPSSVSASPASVGGSGPVTVSATLTGLTQGTTYHYRIRATGPGGTGYSGSGTFSLSILSGLVQVFPDPPPPGSGTVMVNFDPPSRGAWRFAGEQAWRSSGVVAGQLASGLRLIEFLPLPGYISPPKETLDVTHGGNVTLERVYFETMVVGSGGLTVRLKPDELGAAEVPQATRAQWRFMGETVWRDSGGDPLSGLVAGSYLIECKPVSGRVTPPTASISIVDGDSRELTLTYFTANNPGGAAPLPLDFSSVATDEDKPFAFVGQIRSEVGSSTGFVVKRRVVATAGHVVFDDGTLGYITGLQWLFQRHSGEHEPQPQVPRGYYLAAGYAAQRIADASPGEGSAQSQHLDYAALYFLEEAGRGGYGGFLATDAGDDNEFLGSTAEKILAGYAMDGIPAADKGRLHATAEFSTALTPAYGETWTSTAVRGLGGCSGGPLFVRRSNGPYFPAAIYLGGSGQTVVRAINSEVVELFNRAEVSGNGGDNNTGGGITHTSVTAIGSTTQPGSLKVLIEPEAARTAGAGWRLKPEAIYRLSGTQKGSLSPGTYLLEFTAVSGFPAPPQQSVAVTGGQLTTLDLHLWPNPHRARSLAPDPLRHHHQHRHRRRQRRPRWRRPAQPGRIHRGHPS